MRGSIRVPLETYFRPTSETRAIKYHYNTVGAPRARGATPSRRLCFFGFFQVTGDQVPGATIFTTPRVQGWNEFQNVRSGGSDICFSRRFTVYKPTMPNRPGLLLNQ